MNKLALTLLLTATAMAAPAAAATFAVSIGSPVGTPSCGNASASEGAPTSRSLTCAPIGGGSLLEGNAAAAFGYVGGDTGAAVGPGYFGTSFGIGTQSIFSDFVTFTAEDKTLTHVPIAANLAFSGTLNATAFAGASVDVLYSLAGVMGTQFFSANEDGVIRNDFGVAQGSVSAAQKDAILRTGVFMAPVDTPLLMTLTLFTFAGVGGSGSPESATAEFSNSFEVPFGIDAFVLGDGVTANAGDWLVDNRRVGDTQAIPEPAAWALMLLGFGVVGHALRRSREKGPADRSAGPKDVPGKGGYQRLVIETP